MIVFVGWVKTHPTRRKPHGIACRKREIHPLEAVRQEDRHVRQCHGFRLRPPDGSMMRRSPTTRSRAHTATNRAARALAAFIVALGCAGSALAQQEEGEEHPIYLYPLWESRRLDSGAWRTSFLLLYHAIWYVI